jgi:hypothetical protein
VQVDGVDGRDLVEALRQAPQLDLGGLEPRDESALGARRTRGPQIRESGQLGVRLPPTWSTASPLRGTNVRPRVVLIGETPAGNQIDPPQDGHEISVNRFQGGEAMYIGVGTIVAILLIVLLIAFVF